MNWKVLRYSNGPLHIPCNVKREWQMEIDVERNVLIQYPPLTFGDK